VVAFAIIDGLQLPCQGHHGVHQELHLPKSRSKRNITEKFYLFLGHTILHLLTQFDQIALVV
jgi:hypothetical protein